MSVLKLQTLEPVATESAVAVLSLTSSGDNCCKTTSKKPGA